MKKNILKTEGFKCVVVLVLITVLMCGLLAVLNDVLYVTPEERLNRAVESVYGKSVDAEELTIDNERAETTMGRVEKLYAFTDEGVYYELMQTTGLNGYKNGTVTMWVLVRFEGDVPVAIRNVQVDSNEKQTLMSSFGSDFYQKYTSLKRDQLENGTLFKTGTSYDDEAIPASSVTQVVSGATRSSNAMNNAVNTAILYYWGDLT